MSLYSTVFVIDGIGRRQFMADTLAGLSAEWAEFRDAHAIGSSEVLRGGVVMGPSAGGSGECGHLSYNGKIWRNSEARRAEAPIFNPFV